MNKKNINFRDWVIEGAKKEIIKELSSKAEKERE